MNLAINNRINFFKVSTRMIYLFFCRYHKKLKRMQLFCQAAYIFWGMSGKHVIKIPDA
jgi:hypothetical protein